MTPEQERARARASARARVRQMQEARTRSGDPMTPGNVIGTLAGQAGRRAMPTDQERQQLVMSAANRQRERQSVPFGLGFLSQPLANMIRNPEQHAALGRSAAGAVRDIQQIPSLDAGRLASDTAASVQQGVRNLPATLARIPGQLPQIARAVTYGPFADEESAQRRIDLARVRGMPEQAQQAAGEANAAAAGAGVNAAGPLIAGGSVLRAGATGAALTAPFALSRDAERPLQERLPGAVTETLGGAAFGAGAQGLANAIPRIAARPTAASDRAALFDRAGVRPTAAGVTAPDPPAGVPVSADSGRVAAVARAIGENPIVGFMPMGHMRRSLGDTAARAEQLARAYGPRSGPEAVGADLQAGIRRFAMGEGADVKPANALRNWSFDQRADALYRDVFGRIDQAVQRWTQRGQSAPVVADATRIALDDIIGRNTADVAQLVNDPQLYKFREILVGNGSGGRAAGAGRTLQDLRDLRTYVRNLQKVDPSTRPNLGDASLQRLEGALTRDILDSVSFIGDPRLARELRQVDRYYRTGNERIRTALRPFLRENTTPAQAYQMVYRAAHEGGRQNTRMLTAARRSLQPQEWRQVAATAIDEMGRARSGHPYAAEGAFSVEQFALRYNEMSADGRRALFGDLGSPTGQPAGGNFIDLERALDDLARVAGYQKGVEAAANSSKSAVAGQAVATVGGILTAPQVAIPALVGMGITGEMLTNPAFVRWIVSAPQASGAPGGMRRLVSDLSALAARDPALAPVLAELQARAEAEQSQPAPASNGGQAGMPPQREPAFQ